MNFELIRAFQQAIKSRVWRSINVVSLVAWVAAMTALGAPQGDPNDPKSAHDPGVYVLTAVPGSSPRMIAMEPAGYSAKASPGFATVKWQAVVRDAHSGLQLEDASAEFWFYFEDSAHALSPAFAGASSPKEFVLVRMQSKAKERDLMVAKARAYRPSEGFRTEDIIEFDFTKTAPGTYKVVPRQPLTPGEYCFFYGGTGALTSAAAGKMFDFGVAKGDNRAIVPKVDK